MRQLVERIATCGYAEGLIAYTSMATLCMGTTGRPRMRFQELRIEFDPVRDEFHFEYWSQPNMRPGPWRTASSSQEGFARLERILLKRLRWFKQARPTGEQG